jgi:hypothetical protein
MMVLPFLAMVKGNEYQVPLESTKLITPPVDGDAGNVIVKEPPLVSARILSPTAAVYAEVLAVYEEPPAGEAQVGAAPGPADVST